MTPEDGKSERNFAEQESRWSAAWRESPPSLVEVRNVDTNSKFYNLVEFPYPSAEGLHVGHVYTYCGADTLGRYMTMRGLRVIQPMGFDSFGIHTENYALKINEDPKTVTDRAILNYQHSLNGLALIGHGNSSAYR